MRTITKTFLMLAVAAPLMAQGAQPQGAPAPAAPVLPAAGEMAPDFTMPWTNGKGQREDISLSKLRGQVVVLAFYPADFSRGCTIQMSKYRDEYKTIFGEGVTLIPISKDSIPTHTRWADSMAFPFRLASDVDAKVAEAYKSGPRNPGGGFARNIFVIGKDGKITYSARFNPNAQVAYDSLTAAVAAAKK
jgi:thioredoxin-dependent peroxiredoxin